MSEFRRDIPVPLVLLENVLRSLGFGLPFAIPLGVVTKPEWRALLVFVLGTVLCFSSWLPLMYWPDSAWSSSMLGAIAPACTPILWLPPLAVLGQRLVWGHFYRWWMYLLVSIGFRVAHIGHAAIVYMRSA